jgi:phosphoglycerate dehydrogenase-like enzyme
MHRHLRLALACLALLIAACAAGPVRSAGGDARLTYLAARLDAGELAELRAVAPNVDVVVVSRAEALERAAEADGADAGLCSAAFLAAAPKLRWVQAWSAGVDRYLGLDGLMRNDAIAFTNMKGAHGPAIAEHVFAMLLALTRQLPRHRAAQLAGRWSRDASGMTALAGRTLLVVGLGGIGTEVARRGAAFDMRVLATARTARATPEFVEHLGLSDELDALLPQADVVVLCVPLTDETRGLSGAERIARMKRGAYLINIARGAVVDTDALIAALSSGRLAGAGLDVTDPEPLPDGHPLFALDDAVITPHVASSAEITGERAFAVFRENVRRFGAGEPLLNLVDKQAGY